MKKKRRKKRKKEEEEENEEESEDEEGGRRRGGGGKEEGDIEKVRLFIEIIYTKNFFTHIFVCHISACADILIEHQRYSHYH